MVPLFTAWGMKTKWELVDWGLSAFESLSTLNDGMDRQTAELVRRDETDKSDVVVG